MPTSDTRKVLNRFLGRLVFGWFLGGAIVLSAAPAPKPRVLDEIDVGQAWAGHPVGFCPPTAGVWQFTAYFDAQRRMTVAARRLSLKTWTRQTLPTKVDWDSHNGVVMAVDATGRVHMAGNLHNDRQSYNHFKYWETLPPNRDHPCSDTLPPPSPLRLYKPQAQPL